MNNRYHKRTCCQELIGPVALSLLALVLARPAFAVDGVIEINQARATAGSVTAGDTPGFPVSINATGSYRLTGDLNVPAGLDGIDVNSDDVTLDLNGFNIVGGGGEHRGRDQPRLPQEHRDQERHDPVVFERRHLLEYHHALRQAAWVASLR